ncbi:hypothetical protein [Mycobacteroides abscessus]
MNTRVIGLSVALTALLTACAPESGQVVDSAYRPEWVQVIPSGKTTIIVPHPESWELELDNGKDRGWRIVDIQTYHLCSVGKHYPECAQVNQ